MADIKWSAFPSTAAPTAGDVLVGLHSGANYRISTLTVALGGTGQTSLTAYAPLFGGTTSTGALQQTSALTNGQLIIGSTGALPAAATLTAGTGMSISNGAGTITLNATGAGITWSTDATGTISAAIDNGYICGAAGATTVTLPAVAAIGSIVGVEGLGAGGWILTANTGQTIKIGSSTTSSAGTLTSAAASDNVYVICIVANTTWRVHTTNSAGLTIA